MLKINNIILLIVIAGSLLQSCNKESQDDYKKSEIALQAIYDPPFYFSCFSFELIPNEVVINDSVSYKVLENSMLVKTSPGCDTAHFAKIDFNKYTLIGKKVNLSLCDSVTREIAVDTVHQKYIYSIRVKRHVGVCAAVLKISMNWVLVPKLPDDYKVDFDYSEY